MLKLSNILVDNELQGERSKKPRLGTAEVPLGVAGCA
jgi:hypothetical protein